MVRLGMVWYCLVPISCRPDSVWYGMVWYDLIWWGTTLLLQATIQLNDGTQPIAPSPVFFFLLFFCVLF